jgi:hypothetical protein
MQVGSLAHAQIGDVVSVPQTPLNFFTNVASSLLSSELNVNLGQIEIYPTNQYTPAVQRLLQVAANVYDATTTNEYPSVFRPCFSHDGAGNVYVTGYAYVDSVQGPNDVALATPFDAAYISSLSGTFTNVLENIYGVPWIISAKKGFPNFNEFSFESTLGVTRRLQFTRIPAPPGGLPTITGTNQMYEIGYTSSTGMELWNSYASNYNGSILICLNETTTVAITNDDRDVVNPLFLKIVTTNILVLVSPWPGSRPNPWLTGNPNLLSFVIVNPLGPVLTNSVYRSSYASGNLSYTLGLVTPGFIPTNLFNVATAPLLFESNSPNGFYLPQFGVLTTNRLQVYMLDVSNGIYHVIDYVHFAGPDSSYNVNSNLADADNTSGNPFGSGVWDTNYDRSPAPNGLTYGIFNQIQISKGATPGGIPPAEDGQWHSDPNATPLGGPISQQQAYFSAFFGRNNVFIGAQLRATNLDSSIDAPYAPTRYLTDYVTWQVNDPLVHYLVSDINYTGITNVATIPQPGLNHYNAGDTISPLTGLNLGRLNDRYSPWKGNPHYPGMDTNAYNRAERDPLVMSSDSWNFPSNLVSNLSALGQIHRGTPWQSIYLKSSPVNLSAWAAWTGVTDFGQAQLTLPTNDWYVASLLMSILNTNKLQNLLSVNNPDPNAWEILFDGLTALTNTSPGQFSSIVVSSNSSQAALLAGAIQFNRLNQPGQIFRDLGDLLSTPQLADQSPFLDLSNISAIDGMSDEAYEMLPSQLLPLLRSDSIGTTTVNTGQTVIGFTGYDRHVYVIQTSSDLVHWCNLSTNCPVNGTFSLTNSIASGAQFFRSRLLH